MKDKAYRALSNRRPYKLKLSELKLYLTVLAVTLIAAVIPIVNVCREADMINYAVVPPTYIEQEIPYDNAEVIYEEVMEVEMLAEAPATPTIRYTYDFSSFNETKMTYCVTYMGWQTITNPSSKQWELIERVKENNGGSLTFNEDGIGFVNGRYTIAVTNSDWEYVNPVKGGTSTGIATVGDYIDVYLSDGKVINCIVVDVKSPSDPNACCYGHLYGTSTVSVIEFVVDKDMWYERDVYANNCELLSLVYQYESQSEISIDYIEVGNNYLEGN